MSTDRFFNPDVLVRVGPTADDATGGLFLFALGTITSAVGQLRGAREIQDTFSLPQRPEWIAPVASMQYQLKFMKGQASALYGMSGGGIQYMITPGQPQPSVAFYPPVRLPTDAMTLSVRVDGAHYDFDPQPDGKQNIFPFYDYPYDVTRIGNSVRVELHAKPGVDFRQIYLHDRFGNQEVIVHVFGSERLTVAADCCSYNIDDVARLCAAKIWRVQAGAGGEVVVLHPATAPEPQRNAYRYNRDGTLRWQLAVRDFKPNDRILSAQFLANGNVRIRAWDDLWSAEVDDVSGAIVRILDTNER